MRQLLVFLFVAFVSESLAFKGYSKKYWKYKKQCAPIKCDFYCIQQIGEDGCPFCFCDDKKDLAKIECLPPLCPPDCIIEKVEDAPCPECVCKEKKIPPIILCGPLNCPKRCEIEKEFEGPCPGCFCEEKKIPGSLKIHCSMPKCGPGCEIEKDYKGICPECVCKEEEKIEDDKKIEKCDPDLCKGCLITGYDKLYGCPICSCKVDKDIPEIAVDEDDMKKRDEDLCEPFDKQKCLDPGCAPKEDEKGCITCECEPMCVVPKCPWGCSVKKLGKCPECVCKKYKYGKKS